MSSMTIKDKCKVLADFFLPVFETFWTDSDKSVDKEVLFALYHNNLSFQIAFAVEYGLVDVSGLSDTAIQDINGTYDTLVNQDY